MCLQNNSKTEIVCDSGKGLYKQFISSARPILLILHHWSSPQKFLCLLSGSFSPESLRYFFAKWPCKTPWIIHPETMNYATREVVILSFLSHLGNSKENWKRMEFMFLALDPFSVFSTFWTKLPPSLWRIPLILIPQLLPGEGGGKKLQRNQYLHCWFSITFRQDCGDAMQQQAKPSSATSYMLLPWVSVQISGLIVTTHSNWLIGSIYRGCSEQFFQT